MRQHSSSFSSNRLRYVAVALLCLATPAVTEIISDVSNWVMNTPCCGDDCEDSGAPCTNQCMHCVCGAQVLAVATEKSADVSAPRSSLARSTFALDLDSSGHLEPPFRPPVS